MPAPNLMSTINPPSLDAENLAGSNEPPRLDSMQIFIENLTQTRARLDSVKDEITRMEQDLRLLSEERDRLEGYVATYQRILHPVRRLPVDILREIMRAAVGDRRERMDLYSTVKGLKLNRNSLLPDQIPWVLGQVCHHWQEVALAFPSLWSCISVDFPNPGSSNDLLKGLKAQLLRQLQRSGSSKLTIALRSAHILDDNDSLVAAICSHSSRWESLRMILPLENIHSLDHLIGGGIPNLRQLYIARDKDTFGALEDIGAFRVAPRLHDLTVGARNDLDRLPIQWSRITHLRLSLYADAQAINYSFLRSMPNLTSLYVGGVIFDESTPEVALPSLQLLTIHVKGDSNFVEPFLQRINSTHLQALRIHGISQIAIPSRLGRSLRSLHLGGSRLKSVDPTRMFTPTPALEDLSLCGSWDDMLSDLSSRDPSTGNLRWLPQLRDIGFYTGAVSEDCSRESILDLLESRFNGYEATSANNTMTSADESRLQKVRIHRSIHLGEHLVQRLDSLATRGLQVDTSAEDWIHFFPGF
ncbi:hypothetical protein V5O48_006079 [Marasmius crinis-equi]|uniref:F-box domain-containing protein n=1 Tax=Marasmius crinis-equi TaxID=585013 RepID=A0ABR3FKK0_9AGAR